MATYVMSDLHGEYNMFMKMLDKIDFQSHDTLYIIGDVVDRGPHPIKILLQMMMMPNVIPLCGNHELMAMECLDFLRQDITEETIDMLDEKMLHNLNLWQLNGCDSTISEFVKLDRDLQQDVIDYISEFSIYERLCVKGQKYLLVHAGLGHYDPFKKLDEYSLKELIWDRADYDERYFDDVITISGHTPTQIIQDNPWPGYIYRKNNHINLDCGACFRNGRLSCLCLDTNQEYYVERDE